MTTTRLEIGAKNYPLAVNIPISINLAISDIREPDKRNSSFSKSIQLFGTNDVNILFENIFEVNSILNTFNPNKKIEARYYCDNIIVFKGSLQLLSITINPDGNLIYDCSIIGELGGLFFDIGELELSDLDFSAYDHTYNRGNIVSSGSNTSGLGYYYPFVDIGTSIDQTTFSVADFMPCYFFFEYIKKIIEDTGRTFSSSFLNTAFFKSIILYPNFTSIKLTQAQLDDSQLYVGLNSDYVYTIPTPILPYPTIPFDNETVAFFDNGNQNSSGVITVNNNGTYNVAALDKLRFSFTHTDPTVTYCVIDTPAINTIIEKSTDGGATYSVIVVSSNLIVSTSLQVNVATNLDFTNSAATGDQLFNSGDKIKHTGYISYNPPITYYNASNVQILTGTGTPVFKLLSGNTGSSFYMLSSSEVAVDGSDLDGNSIIPTKIKQRDFFKSVIQLFGLLVDIDQADSNNLIIEPYDDYYNNGIVDWSNRTDLNKEIKVNPIGLLDAKRYIFKYKDDVDLYNRKYKDEFNETYGTHVVDVDNDFLKTDKVNELIFSASPTVSNYDMGANIVKIYKDQDTRASMVPNVRILIANGIKQSVNQWTFKGNGLSDLVDYDYNDALMEDDALNPNISLQFGYPKKLYYDFLQPSFPDSIMYNLYQKRRTETITSKDSKVDSRFLWVSALEMGNFSFRKRYFIDGSYWIVNRVIDYNPMNEGSYKFELIRLLELW